MLLPVKNKLSSFYTETRFYINGIEFSGEGTSASRLASINAGGNGRVAYQYESETGAPTGKRVEYYHTDHLGNVRLAFSDLDGDGSITVTDIYDPSNEITQERHYYPFGLTHTGPWYATVSPDNAYRYNGKELDEATGLYDYGARYYDPAIARWGQVDPLADTKRNAPFSPYNYVVNNPITNIDPDGRDWYKNMDTGKIHWQEGSNSIDGYDNLGGAYTFEGSNHTIIYNQNQIVSITENTSNLQQESFAFVGAVTIGEFTTTGAALSLPKLLGGGVLVGALVSYPRLKLEEIQSNPGTYQFYTSSGTYIRLPYTYYKRISSSAEADRVAREWGYDDAHDLKDAHGVGSEYDIYRDGKTGKGELRPHRKGSTKEHIPIDPNH